MWDAHADAAERARVNDARGERALEDPHQLIGLLLRNDAQAHTALVYQKTCRAEARLVEQLPDDAGRSAVATREESDLDVTLEYPT